MHTNMDTQVPALMCQQWRMRMDGSKLNAGKGFIIKDDAIIIANDFLSSATRKEHLESKGLKLESRLLVGKRFPFTKEYFICIWQGFHRERHI